MKILAVVNRKGGVGKTTLAVNVAAGFARRGRRVLLVDMDSQGSATRWLLGELAEAGTAEALVAGAAAPAHIVPDPTRPRLDLMPSSRTLATAELALGDTVGGEVALREVLADFRAYSDCQARAEAAFRDRAGWARRAILNTARMGKFSSDRTIREYARDIWSLPPVAIP